MHSTIAVDDLRVGMYIQLEGGWMSHPFPRSSFRIGSAEQIAVIRGLGLARVAWVPEKSELLEEEGAASSGAGMAGELGTAGPADAGDADPGGTLGTAAAAAAAPDPAQAHREALQAQREALQRCEQAHTQAARDWRALHDDVLAQPQRSRAAAEALVGGLCEQLAVAGDIGLRLLGRPSNDRAAAHALNVAVISMLIGRTFGMAAQEMLDLGLGALLHDIGKIDLPERVRHADEAMSSAEHAAWREHVTRGVAHGRRLGLSAGALAVVAQHHEHADGSGFPARLPLEGTTLAARIVAIAEHYDTLCNPPLAARALTPHEAVARLFAQGSARHDGAVLNAFIRMMGVYPAGSLVQLTDDRWAMVVGVNSSRPLKPRVLVHDPAVPAREALVLNLEQVPDLGVRRSLPPARVPPAVLRYLDPRPRVTYHFEAMAAQASAQGTPALTTDTSQSAERPLRAA